MTILVDNAHWPNHGRYWCHLVSDHSLQELHDFARQLGIPEHGFGGDHYDLPDMMRDVALRLGAVAVESRELVIRLRAAGLRKRMTNHHAFAAGRGAALKVL
ncbi:MAG: DUF4031 domain-containing protein [Candidatus Nanopelagicales bacterium]